MSYESIELSPGFFDPQVAMSDEEDAIIPLSVDIEKSKKGVAIFNDENTNENKEDTFVEDVVVFMFTAQKGCGCSGGWKRTATY